MIRLRFERHPLRATRATDRGGEREPELEQCVGAVTDRASNLCGCDDFFSPRPASGNATIYDALLDALWPSN